MQEFIFTLDQVTAGATQAFADLSPEALNWKPNPDRWSIAQNLDHLITINESYYPVVEKAQLPGYSLPWYARFELVPSLMGSMLLKSVSPENQQKTNTFTIWQPQQGNIAADILQQFQHHQEDLKKVYLTKSASRSAWLTYLLTGK